MAGIEAHTEGHEIKTFEPTFPTEQTSLPSTQSSRRGKVPAASGDKQNHEQNSASQEVDETIQYSKKQSASNGGLQWITGNKPDDLRTKHVMQTVRQNAMGSYLKGARKMAESRTSVGSQDASKPRSTRSLKGKGKKTSEVQTPSEATWETTELSVEDVIDGSSTITTTPDPIRSVFSTESSMTLIKVFSRRGISEISRKQLQIATRVFVSVIQSDQVLGPIYESGRNDPTLEPKILRGYVFETLISYARNLRNEAKDHLEVIASNLVLDQVSHAARCISDDYKWTHGLTEDADDSSDDEVQGQSVDERQFNDDLDAFRSFLTQSNAFATLRTETQSSYLFRPTVSVTESSETYVGEDIQDTAMFMVTNLLVSLECLEPPLQTGWTRIKIECHTCGERSFDDVLEHREGGIAELKQWMERALNATITVVHPNDEAASTHGRLHSPALVHNILRGLQKISTWGKSPRDPVLPEHNGPQLENYDFACPLDSTYPVIPPRAFAHMLKHTTRDVHEDQTHIYRWVPKRKGTILDVDPKTELADAWGLYFEEGWDPNDIMTLFGLVFVVSLIFLVCWSKYTSDVSAASGVSSYMITVAGIAISLLVIRAGNM
ncbi:hypothetical protein J4E82_006920 [Alternaria postmessia]|uniref:uncharacterized protein n=1 Tax=Alternaria postmessia TaxID=1187938 RepID=UPI00222560DB|nr:uncharacterized protein J4E82_006920 [Alternaria postmessia]KAI5374350.1 hypothetical protein J4E82_006920 [Alternaria postmessia]